MRLRQRRAPLLATLAAVALGAALVAACGGLFETALRLDAPPQRFAGADVVVAAAEHAQVNEHAVALTERARLPRGLADELRGAAGRLARARRSVRARGAHRPIPTPCGRRSHGRPVEPCSPATTAAAARSIGVAAARLKLILIASIFGGMALIVMAILVASIISLAVEQRHRELALLRTIGATPRQVRRLVVAPDRAPGAGRGGRGRARRARCWRARCSTRFQDGGVVPSVLALRQGVLPLVAGALGGAAGRARRRGARGAAGGQGHARRGARRGRGARARSGASGSAWRCVLVAGAVVVRRHHAVHAARQRVRDRRRDGARGRARLRAGRPAAGRAPRREALGCRGAARRPPGHAGRAQPARARAPHRRARDPGAPRGRDRAGQRLPAHDAVERDALRVPRPGATTAPTRCAARAGSSSPSIRRTRSIRGRCSAPTRRPGREGLGGLAGRPAR